MIVVRIALLVAAGWALRRELTAVSARDFTRELRSFGLPQLGLALGCMIVSFVVLGAIELLALRHAAPADGRRVPARVGMWTSFVANGLSQSIGLSVVTGTAVRIRSYARCGLGVGDVARVTGFVTLTTTLGLLATGAWALASGPLPAPGVIASFMRPAAAVCGAIVAAYVLWSFFGRNESLGHGSWRVSRPAPRLALRQLGLSVADWLLTGTVLFAVLPGGSGIGYVPLLGAYLVAQVAGVTSHVPAGAGVFEVVMLALLAGGDTPAERAALVAALVMFRVIYYLLPLGGAVAVASASELLGSNGAPAV